jgi:fatty acid desaturase
VIIDDNGPLAFLFLNNNLHAVHHMHPMVAWYNLPQLYRQNAQSYDSFNEGYNYPSYANVFARFFVNAKDPVPHPLWGSER